MKKLLLSFVVLPGALAIAQVGINTEEPKAMLDISAKDNQKGDLRIQDVEEKSTQWLLVWDEKDQKVKRRSLSDLKYDMILDKGKINYIRSKQPAKADDIIKKIKQCAPENIAFDKLFGVDGKHDFVYCATTVTGVTGTNYNRTWLNLNLGAEYADINSPHFDPTVSKTGTDAHEDDRTYGSLYQWQRASDGHEFRDSEATDRLAYDWIGMGELAGKFITNVHGSWVRDDIDRPGRYLYLWGAVGVSDPCPSGYHVPTDQEWEQFHEAVAGDAISGAEANQMMTQNKLPNLAAAGCRDCYEDENINEIQQGIYWASDNSYDRSRVNGLLFHNGGSSPTINTYFTAHGYSVRCIKNN
ncbi:fibrobacter succinogenes major paralogous domain [Candidatus Ornithobacterium hominis]|uniref:Fibrobacter succinogenes major paralogous domain n=1 Tax=Candidatus Ornithobacterium hominis TaxID=2497989 RepID=A0A383TUD3_9FLAO|nr:FISUMP domain-containing protein [Candidatus Ornithobacterium hominis]MCT7903620.1 fibrobacter succinogenes major paralogous domain-containing protein [Candidatus Ornithobacterium hominis]SZD70957.1 fibrobacter succinogenes major paralogous domain [Candidatus Ornithobacterium hominis]